MSQLHDNVINLGSKYQSRVLAVASCERIGVRATAIKSGFSERTLRHWNSRYRDKGTAGLRDVSRAPHTVWNKKDQDGKLGKALCDLVEKEPGLNNLQIFAKLIHAAVDTAPTASWIKREKRRRGLCHERKKKKNTHKIRYEIEIPGALQVDTKYVISSESPDDIFYQFTAIDECSRVRFMAGSLFKSAGAARRFLIEAITFYSSIGVEVWRVQTDHGTEFTLPENEQTTDSYIRGNTEDHIFTKECKARGIKHRLIKIATPELNGKVERSHRIDNERFYSRFYFTRPDTLDHALKTQWMPEYNEKRPHGSLKGYTPMDFLRKRLREMKNQNLQQLIESYEQRRAA